MTYYKIVIKKLSDIDGKKVYIKDKVLKVKRNRFDTLLEELIKDDQFYEIYECYIGLFYFKKVFMLSNIIDTDTIDTTTQDYIFDDGENPFEKEEKS